MSNIYRIYAVIYCILALVPLIGGELEIIATGDIHGSRENFARLAPLIRARKRAIKIDVGDLFHGDPLCDMLNGKPMVDALNSLNFDIYIPGNHEFELSGSQSVALFGSFKGEVLGQWSVDGFHPRRWKVVERNGFRCAIIGMSDNGLWRSRRFYPWMKIVEEFSAVKQALKEIRKQPVDLIILARHGGNYSGSVPLGKFLRQYPEIDLVICGHSHREIVGQRSGRVMIIQPGALGASAVLATVRRIGGKTLHIESRLLRPQADVDPEISAVFARALNSQQAELDAPALNVVSQSSFAEAVLKNIRQTLNTDCAVTDLPELPCGRYTKEQFLKLFPYRNVMAVVTVSRAEYLNFVREKAPGERRRFSSEMPENKENFSVAVNLFQLQRSTVLRSRKDFRLTGVIERDIILKEHKL